MSETFTWQYYKYRGGNKIFLFVRLLFVCVCVCVCVFFFILVNHRKYGLIICRRATHDSCT